jgi:hypothetical protein
MELRLDCSEVVADVVAEVVAEAEAIVTATATATATAATEARENSLPSSQRSSGCLSVHDPVISAVPLLSRRRRGTGHQPAKKRFCSLWQWCGARTTAAQQHSISTTRISSSNMDMGPAPASGLGLGLGPGLETRELQQKQAKGSRSTLLQQPVCTSDS